jgi:hypothetical protein
MYFGGGFVRHNLKDVEFDGSLNGGAVKIGYDIARFFAIEGHLGATIPEDYYRFNNQGRIIGDYSVRSEHAALYARGNWRLRNVILYGTIGYGYYGMVVNEKIEGQYDITYSSEQSGLTYGFGMDLFGSRRTALTLSWSKLINEESESDGKLDVDAVFLGITYYFKPQNTTHSLE